MKKITFLFVLLFSALISCKDEQEKLFDAYFLAGVNDDVILVNLDKYYQKYPKTKEIFEIDIKGQIENNGKIIATFDKLIYTGFQNYFRINILKIQEVENSNIKLTMNNFEYTAKIKDLINQATETFKNNILLSLNIDQSSPQIVTFILNSLRVREIKDEYLATAQRTILIIENEKGQEVFNTSNGMVFNQAISPVLPMNNGEIFKQVVPWNYLNNDNKKVGKGKYYASMIIPSYPVPYTVKSAFTIE